MDTISRAAAIDLIDEYNACGYVEEPFEQLEKALLELPSAQQWIPCSETVDIPDHEILACDKYGEEMFGYLGYEDEQWMCASEDCVMYDPIAWCEKPEPYKERREE